MKTVTVVRPEEEDEDDVSCSLPLSVSPEYGGQCELHVPGVSEGRDDVGEGQLLLLLGDAPVLRPLHLTVCNTVAQQSLSTMLTHLDSCYRRTWGLPGLGISGSFVHNFLY